MSDRLEIRPSLPDDWPAIERLYRDAFPDENLVPLVVDLLAEEEGVRSLVGLLNSVLVGHVAFTTCAVTNDDVNVAMLAPLAVGTSWHKRGIGSELVRDGLHRLARSGVSRVYVLGDPNYYSRFGFVPETDVAPPYPLPAEWDGAWQSVGLGQTAPRLQGQLVVPRPWLRPALWQP
ncbi:MAG: GNAT family N-acetyltransferase [Hyphomicrobiaceae bacterium]